MKKLRTILWSTLGFGLGGLITGYSGNSMLIGFALMGLLGGIAWGYSLGLRTSSVVKIALYGAVGFFFGFTIPFFIMLTLWEPPSMKFFLTGLFGGGFGGIMLGLSVKSKMAVLKLGVGGAIGFGCGMFLLEFFKMPLVFAVVGILGGTAIGFVSEE